MIWTLWIWSWGGASWGYRRGKALFTPDGHQVGRFRNGEVYGSDGRYLGEIRNRNRLITDLSKKTLTQAPFVPRHSTSYNRYADSTGYAMCVGYENFPSAETFKIQVRK